jgi:predicted transcriptional regulator
MATARRTVQVNLDEKLVSRARAEARDANRPDDEIIEEALSGYLLERLLDKTQRRAGLSEEDATRLAIEELHAMRRERDAAG